LETASLLPLVEMQEIQRLGAAVAGALPFMARRTVLQGW
jgi:hypothetical protein